MKIIALDRQQGKTKEAVNNYLNLKENRIPAIIVVPMPQDCKLMMRRVAEEALDRARKHTYYSLSDDPTDTIEDTIRRDILPSDEYFKRIAYMSRHFRDIKVIMDDFERFPRFANVTMITTTPDTVREQPKWKES